jgi:hypothetical protein
MMADIQKANSMEQEALLPLIQHLAKWLLMLH